ncbi:MAG: glycogen debranching enzyme family protein [Phycisphaerae bacterium]|nr:glycogen debranching enzyme family protein [Phycisphaerae bacterium]
MARTRSRVRSRRPAGKIARERRALASDHGPAPTLTRGAALGAAALQRAEWLLTSGQGAFAMGTALGPATRRYHGLLIASLRPPVRRVMALNAVADTLTLEPGTTRERRVPLTSFVFAGSNHAEPDASPTLSRFERDLSCRWVHECEGVEVVRQVHVIRDANAVEVAYTIRGLAVPARLSLSPLVSLRDFHSLLRDDRAPASIAMFQVEAEAARAMVRRDGVALDIRADRGTFERAPHWWHNFEYRLERERGYDFVEDLFCPGSFHAELPFAPAGAARGTRRECVVTLAASVGEAPARASAADRAARSARLSGCVRALISGLRESVGDDEDRRTLALLAVAADDFIVRRAPLESARPPRAGTTIIAGYPWFADWGRDALIALPGLLLETGRHAEALGVLRTFAEFVRDGLVPNVFDDYTSEPKYNTADAPLWFIHASCAYLREARDRRAFDAALLPACLAIVAGYRKGTHHHIRVDPVDGLVAAGDPATQLTWMDAQRDGVTFTPRHGKPVEINALWYNALMSLAAATRGKASKELLAAADRVAASFRAKFWNPGAACLYDTLPGNDDPNWPADGSVRPNQILAASLPHSPLNRTQQRAVLETVAERLYSPLGVRTLAPGSPAYAPRYEGTMFQRDAAYHNGTAWPWLSGLFAEAVLRVGGFSEKSRRDARRAIQPLLAYLSVGDCPGHLPEIFDAEGTDHAPQRPQGCPAQAWSLATCLRAFRLILAEKE